MIKDLIIEISYDKIKLSQALTRSKLLANKIKNELFRKWLDKELGGYAFQDEYLPEYRKVLSIIQVVLETRSGQSIKLPVNVSDTIDPKFWDAINFHQITESIAIVEEQIQSIDTPKAYVHLPPQLVEVIAEQYKGYMTIYQGFINKGFREIGRIHYQNVIEQTKQKLIDTLIELENDFPNLENTYAMTDENKERVQNIVTTNIYGNNNPLNIAAGQDVTQREINNTISADSFAELEKLGVEKDKIVELKQLVSTDEDKTKKKNKIMQWLGSVTSSIAARGLYDNIPTITAFVANLIP